MDETARENIDVEAIMAEIRADVKARGIVDDIPGFKGCGAGAGDGCDRQLEAMEQSYMLLCDLQFSNNPVKRFIQRLVCRTARFYVEPLAQEQSAYNEHTLWTLRESARRIETLEARVAALEAKLSEQRQ
ncbi:MAG: hypothetical protein Q4E65_09520 [Clostridia bacterium]|nr:hypothetical protein [Clostridia bacterium]